MGEAAEGEPQHLLSFGQMGMGGGKKGGEGKGKGGDWREEG